VWGDSGQQASTFMAIGRVSRCPHLASFSAVSWKQTVAGCIYIYAGSEFAHAWDDGLEKKE
jgi:hypothetical protein